MAKWQTLRSAPEADLNLPCFILRGIGAGGQRVAFTDEERLAWHERKRTVEHHSRPAPEPPAAPLCVNCQNPFGINEGVITDEVALCDICSGD
jgi:hypothetical protein